MEESVVGDQVLGGIGCSKVYGFGHGFKHSDASYVRLVMSSTQPLELSYSHQVFILETKTREKQSHFAMDVKVGDIVFLLPGSEADSRPFLLPPDLFPSGKRARSPHSRSRMFPAVMTLHATKRHQGNVAHLLGVTTSSHSCVGDKPLSWNSK